MKFFISRLYSPVDLQPPANTNLIQNNFHQICPIKVGKQQKLVLKQALVILIISVA